MRFSVIIPLYNKASYVDKAIGSVLSQTYADYELVIMDDGSSDSSFEVAAKAIEGKENCYIYQQQNAGVSMARNNAVAKSHGDYLCFLDADDWWVPSYLEEMDGFISRFPDAGIYGTNYTIVNETKHKTRVAPIGVEPGFKDGYINYCKVYAKTLAMPLWTGAVAIPRAIFNEMQGFPRGIKLGEDFMLWIRIALKYKVAFLNKPLAYYNQDSNPVWRGVGHLVAPESHMLWNLQSIEAEETSNPDYKLLIDNLRTYGLLPFYLSRQYRIAARQELAKVEWTRQTDKLRNLYKTPVFLLKCRQVFLKIGVTVKQALIKYL